MSSGLHSRQIRLIDRVQAALDALRKDEPLLVSLTAASIQGTVATVSVTGKAG